MENNRKRVLNHITLSKAPCSIVPSLLTVYSTCSGAEREQCGFFWWEARQHVFYRSSNSVGEDTRLRTK